MLAETGEYDQPANSVHTKKEKKSVDNLEGRTNN